MPQIEAKKTWYRGTLYNSRLEARWAVFLDYHFMVNDFRFEPRTFRLSNGWSYTPDFYVKTGPLEFFLEVKPDVPTIEYLEERFTFQAQMKVPLYIGYGSFYREDPMIVEINTSAKPCSVADFPFFPQARQPLDLAHRYRFDMKDATPSHKKGSGAQLMQNLQRVPQVLPPKKKRKRKPRKKRRES